MRQFDALLKRHQREIRRQCAMFGVVAAASANFAFHKDPKGRMLEPSDFFSILQEEIEDSIPDRELTPEETLALLINAFKPNVVH